MAVSFFQRFARNFISRKLKKNIYLISWFLIGTLLGTWMSSHIQPFQECRSCFQNEILQKTFTRNNNELLVRQNNFSPNQSWKKPRILCWILISKYPKKSAAYIEESWGRHCDILLFFGDIANPERHIQSLSTSNKTVNGLWNKTIYGFKYVYENYQGQYDWIYHADDQSFCIVDNIRYITKDMDPSKPLYMRKSVEYDNISNELPTPGPGTVLSHAATKKFVEGLADENCANPAHIADNTELRFSHCMQYLGVEFVDSRDSRGRLRFIAVDLPQQIDWDHCSPTLVAARPIDLLFLNIAEFVLSKMKAGGIVRKSNSTCMDKEIFYQTN